MSLNWTFVCLSPYFYTFFGVVPWPKYLSSYIIYKHKCGIVCSEYNRITFIVSQRLSKWLDNALYCEENLIFKFVDQITELKQFLCWINHQHSPNFFFNILKNSMKIITKYQYLYKIGIIDSMSIHYLKYKKFGHLFWFTQNFYHFSLGLITLGLFGNKVGTWK